MATKDEANRMANSDAPYTNKTNLNIEEICHTHGDFSAPWNMSDIALKVEDEVLHVHRCILSLWSPVFHRMLTGDFREKNEDVIALPGRRAQEIREMLEVMYDRRKQITDDNCEFLLQLADEFQMDQLRDESIEYLENSDKSGINALKYMNMASRYRLRGIHDACIESAKDLPTEILNNAEVYQSLDNDSKISVLTARLTKVEEALKKHEILGNYLVSYLYGKANEEYVAFLRGHGLEETSLSKCENYERHRSEYIGTGKKFCLHCKACRHRINAVNKFSVKTSDVFNTVEKLYDMIYGERPLDRSA